MNKLPPNTRVHGQYYSFRFREGGKYKRVKLCHKNSSMGKVWLAYEEHIAGNILTIEFLFNQYIDSTKFKRLAVLTQKDYLNATKRLLPVFGKMNPTHLRTTHVQKYMDKRSSQKRANVERTVLMNVYKWALARFDAVTTNPAVNAEPFKMSARDRYIEDSEYNSLLADATPAIKVAMELSYLCAARQGDILKLKWTDLSEEGIYIKQGKTGKAQIKLWNAELKRVISDARKLSGIASAIYVISTCSGSRYTSSGFRSIWHRVKLRAGITDVTFHDIKAKSISDYQGDKQYFSGHKTRSQMERYNRTVDRVQALIEPKRRPKT